MGLDLEYQAYPDNCDILNKALQDGEWADYLCSLDLLAQPGHADLLRQQRAQNPNSKIPPDMVIEFAQAAYELNQQHPGLITRNLFWGRHWDMLHFLLSEKRRSVQGFYIEQDDDSWGWAIFGRYPFTGTSMTVRYSPAKEAHDACDLLFTVTRNSLAAHFEEMLRVGAYKSPAVDTDERYIDGLWYTFNELKAFYEIVIQHNEGVVVKMF